MKSSHLFDISLPNIKNRKSYILYNIYLKVRIGIYFGIEILYEYLIFPLDFPSQISP